MKVSAILASIPAVAMAMEIPNVAIEAASKAGSRLLSKARRLENNDNSVDSTWVAGYSLKFHSCVANQDYYGGYFANGEGDDQNANQGNYYYSDAQRNGYQGMYVQQLVHFKLCPTGSCTFCQNGADYVVDLSDFVDAYLEAKMTAIQYKCERVRENCYCENAYSADACLYGCMQNAGLGESDCVENGGQNQNSFNLQEAVECMKVDVDEDAIQGYYTANGQQQQEGNQNNGMDKLYVGPFCASNGRSIHLGAFTDETCSYPAPTGMYEAINYGSSLPYAKKSIIDSGCVSCKEPTEVENQNEWDQQDADSVTQVCSTLYSSAAKCEEGLKGYFPYRNTYGCTYIKSLQSASVIPKVNIGAKAAAGIFGVTTVILAGLAASLHKKSSRQNVSLTGDHVLA